MKNFIALYCNTTGAHLPMPELTEEQQAQMFAPWMAWQEGCGDQLVSMGSQVAPAVASNDGNAWSPSKNFVTGYSIVSANSLEEAQKLFVGHPIYNHPGISVEISECFSM